MKILLLSLSIIFFNINLYAQNDELYVKYKDVAKKIIEEVNKNDDAWESLAYMCDTFGPRLSGSDNHTKALLWMEQEMKKDGLENVKKEEVMVPHWVRNEESCYLLSPFKAEFKMLGLGGSISTGGKTITSEVYVVKDLAELQSNPEKAKGKIVVFNCEYKGYGATVQYRLYGADWASNAGAIASLIRSVSPVGNQNPHTGVMYYSDTIPKIPHAAITHEDAAMLQRMQDRGQKPIISLNMNCETLPDAVSYNVMGEMIGTSKKEEIVAIGGHSDSWDVGQGALDDGSGCLSTWKAVKILKDLGLRPKRTIRAVMWTNEENGTAGGNHYAKTHHDKENHWAMFEFDSGVYPPSAIGYTGNNDLYKYYKSAEKLLKMVREDMVIKLGGGGVDIGPMMKLGVTGMSLSTDSKGTLFHDHHADTDTMDKIDKQEFRDCIAAIAIAVYVYADIEDITQNNTK